MFATPPVACSSFSPTRLFVTDVPSHPYVKKRCIDLAIVEGNAAAGVPLLFALFAASNDTSKSPVAVGPTELRAFRLNVDGAITAYGSTLSFAGPYSYEAVGTALAADPGDSNSVYVALGAAWLHKVDIQTSTFSASAVTTVAAGCSPTACTYGEQMRDIAIVRTSAGNSFLYAACDYGRVLEYELGTTNSKTITISDGYLDRIAAITDAGTKVLVAVGVADRSGLSKDTAAPYWLHGVWVGHCLDVGLPDPNGVDNPPGHQLRFYQRDTSVTTSNLAPAPDTTPPFENPAVYYEFWGGLVLRRITANGFRAYACTNNSATTVFHLRRPFGGIGPLSFGTTDPEIDRIATYVGPAIAPVDGTVSEINQDLAYFGLDGLGKTNAGGSMVRVQASPLDIVIVDKTKSVCSTTTTLATLDCPVDSLGDPNPFVGSILGSARWRDPVDATREYFFPGGDSWIKTQSPNDCSPEVDLCETSACSLTRGWKKGLLPGTPTVVDKVAYKLVGLTPGAVPLDGPAMAMTWQQLAIPNGPAERTETVAYASSTSDPRLEDPPPVGSGQLIPKLVHGARTGSDWGYKVFRPKNILERAALTCAGSPARFGERIRGEVAKILMTHIEFEDPSGSVADDECKINIVCQAPPGGSRALYNFRCHVFSITHPTLGERWIAAMAAGFVASHPSTVGIPQPLTCLWDDHYGSPLTIFYDVTDTVGPESTSALGSDPILLRVALGPLDAQQLPIQGNSIAVRTKAYTSGPFTGKTFAFVGDTFGRLHVYDVSHDQLYPAPSPAWSPIGSPYLPTTATRPLLRPAASLDFPIDPCDGLKTNCIDVEVDPDPATLTVYCALSRAGVGIVDVSIPSSPLLSAVLDTPGFALGIALRKDGAKDQAFIGDSRGGMRLLGRQGE